MLDLTTTVCFLLFQVTIFPPTKVQKPVVDFLSMGFLAQSALVNPTIPLFFNKVPLVREAFRYKELV